MTRPFRGEHRTRGAIDLTQQYGCHAALDRLTPTIPPGEILHADLDRVYLEHTHE